MASKSERNRRYIAALDAVEKIEAGLVLSLGGPISVTIDGQTTQFNHAQALEALVFFEKRIERNEPGRANPRSATIRLDNSV